MKKHILSNFYFIPLLFAVLMVGCVKDDSDNAIVDAENSDETGELIIQLTDAKGDFTNYTVDVVSLSLTKKNGAQVDVLPEKTRVDFSQYVEMTEFFTAATIPNGVYTAASISLDYSNAEIFVEDVNGDSVQVTDIQNEDGEVITTLEASVVLEERNQLRIVRGVPALLSLDFDLKTSNAVSFDDADVPSVVVSPVLNANLEPEKDKTHRARGPLKSVDVTDKSFDLIIRPFRHKMNDKHERFGKLHVDTTDTTVFEINGESLTGEAALLAMDGLDQFTGVVVLGDIAFAPKKFTATQVYAGSSVPGGDSDVVKGTVLSRTGNELLVKGATLIRAGGSVFFNDAVTVLVDETTTVHQAHDSSEKTIADISVGQRIAAFGLMNDDTANMVLDATNGGVRMEITTLRGTVTDTSTSDSAYWSVSLSTINKRKLELFDFSGTGIDAENDANPTEYEIETSDLDNTQYVANLPVLVKGFVAPFGSAPADFFAKSITSLGSIKAVMHTNWRPASATAFSEINETQIVFDFTEAGKFHHLGRRGNRVDLTELSVPFALVPNNEDAGIYVIHLPGSKHVHNSFVNLSNDLQDQINAGLVVKNVQAKGEVDLVTGQMMVEAVRVKFR